MFNGDVLRKLDSMDVKLNQLLAHVFKLQQKVEKMAGELDTLKTQVAKNTDTEQSAIVLLQGLKAKLDAAIASGDPAQLQALSDALGTSQTQLAAAVVANTPQAPNAPAAKRKT